MRKNEGLATVRAELLALCDAEYADFQRKLMPTVPPERVIGVRTPLLRKYAKKLAGTEEARQFLQVLPHFYYEENNLHAALLEPMRDFDEALAAVERFLPYVDNWATCDSFCPKALRMAVAWLFSFALIKQYDATLPYLTEDRLPAWTHNKAIQKAIESYRVTPATKAYLKTLKRKESRP